MAKKYKVTTPVQDFKGERLEVKFVDGAAEVSKKTARKLLQEFPDYSCPELEDQTSENEKTGPEPKKIEEYTKQILLDTAKEVMGCDYLDRMNKDELVINIIDDLDRQELAKPEIRAAFHIHALSLEK